MRIFGNTPVIRSAGPMRYARHHRIDMTDDRTPMLRVRRDVDAHSLVVEQNVLDFGEVCMNVTPCIVTTLREMAYECNICRTAGKFCKRVIAAVWSTQTSVYITVARREDASFTACFILTHHLHDAFFVVQMWRNNDVTHQFEQYRYVL